uniref:Uncharacterized protein n=1 Tax=Hyaloperonospora arabidopsidis (strain Emoy2) TaxID=559515 RepID=M4BJY5_HYAAE
MALGFEGRPKVAALVLVIVKPWKWDPWSRRFDFFVTGFSHFAAGIGPLSFKSVEKVSASGIFVLARCCSPLFLVTSHFEELLLEQILKNSTNAETFKNRLWLVTSARLTLRSFA